MANELSGNEPIHIGDPVTWQKRSAWDVIKLMLAPLASLKLTVVLFSLGLFVVFVGTLAQDKMEIWRAVDVYFHAWQINIPVNVFFPSEWFPELQDAKGSIWFPGGMLIGVLMMINLTAAHAVRFKIQSRGGRLAGGLAVIGLGLIVTLVVILSGHNAEGLQGEPPFKWSTFWTCIKVGLVGLFLASLAATAYVFVKLDRARVLERLAMLGVLPFLLVLTIFLWNISATDAALRIVWQLLQGSIAGLVLLGGCMLAFKKRAGIVLLHSGIMLLMVNELVVKYYNVEEQIALREGETATYAADIRAVELAIVDRSSEKEQVTVVPLARHGSLTQHVEDNRVLEHKRLPFDMQVVKYLENSSDLRALKDGESTLATRGIGRFQTVDDFASVAGADTGGGVNQSSAYVKFTKKGSGKDLGTYLLTQWAYDSPERITVDGKTYELYLRFKRARKDYAITLLETGRKDYLGTKTPRDFYSDVHLVDETRNFEQTKKIWMNNPLRYAGETFYQSGHNVVGGVEYSTLQVVKNRGWMIPYVACGIVAIGLLSHFWIILVRFLRRVSTQPTASWGFLATTMNGVTRFFEAVTGIKQEPQEPSRGDAPQKPPKPKPARTKRQRRPEPPPSLAKPAPTNRIVNVWLPVAAVVLCGAWLASRAPTPEAKPHELNLYEFGKLPVAFGGRVKPIDTLARNSLRVISGRQTLKEEDGKTHDAVRWFLDAVTRSPAARKHRIFRVDNLEVLDTLGLKRRKGYRYSIEEILENYSEFSNQARQARVQFQEYQRTKKNRLSVYQKKLIDLEDNLNRYATLVRSFSRPEIPLPPTMEERQKDPHTAQFKIQQFALAFQQFHEETEKLHPPPPLAVPVLDYRNPLLESDETWQTFPEAWAWAEFTKSIEETPHPAVDYLDDMFQAYAKADVAAFNNAVTDYRDFLERKVPDGFETTSILGIWDIQKVDMEAWFNHFGPFHVCIGLYVIVLIVAFVGILTWAMGWNQPIQRVAFWITVLTFAVHTGALLMRMAISDRPPVTNLYSSAVFIGWACVLAGMVLEIVFRLGLGNIISAIAGFATLLIAYGLAADGDTLEVLVAVLDTQFWLSTHVICITLGYAATYLAGLFGFLYIVMGVTSPLLVERVGDRWTVGKVLSTMIYGTVCFAIFFSFVGTVLGGLWADDSWGRFWGWDPKENGALIIVIWNALVLHARWGNMVKDRGLAVLVIGGNIVTTWSWFAVNQLGIGLHSYGFTEGVLMAVGLFMLSQFVIMAVGSLPKNLWWSYRAQQQREPEVSASEGAGSD